MPPMSSQGCWRNRKLPGSRPPALRAEPSAPTPTSTPKAEEERAAREAAEKEAQRQADLKRRREKAMARLQSAAAEAAEKCAAVFGCIRRRWISFMHEAGCNLPEAPKPVEFGPDPGWAGGELHSHSLIGSCLTIAADGCLTCRITS